MSQNLHIIFDLDGTLIDSSPGVIESVNYALTRTSQPIQAGERIKRYIGCPLDQMFADFTDQPYETLLNHFREKAATAVVQAATPLSGVNETLKRLHADGYEMGIATTKIRSQVEGILERLGWAGYFKAISGGDEVTRVKPAPDIFRLTLERMKVPREKTIVVGDTVNDVHGGRAAGLKVIAIPSEFGTPETLHASNPDWMIEQFADLPVILKEISQNHYSE